MGTIASQITSLTVVYSIVYSGADQRKHQSSASLAFVRGIHRWPVNSPHKGPVTRKMFPFDDVIMSYHGRVNTYVDAITTPYISPLFCIARSWLFVTWWFMESIWHQTWHHLAYGFHRMLNNTQMKDALWWTRTPFRWVVIRSVNDLEHIRGQDIN